MLGGDAKRFGSYDRKEIREALNQLDGWELYQSGRRLLSFGTYYGRQRGYIKKGAEVNIQRGKHIT